MIVAPASSPWNLSTLDAQTLLTVFYSPRGILDTQSQALTIVPPGPVLRIGIGNW
jgi:hypothetical protein